MMDFIISKINLLIFVIAVATVVLFFSSNLEQFFLAQRASEIANNLVSESTSLIAAPTSCDSTVLAIPYNISIFGKGLEERKGRPYNLSIIKLEQVKDFNVVVFSISLKGYKEKDIAAKNLLANARIRLFDFNVDGSAFESDSIVLDPQAEVPENRIVLIKESAVSPVLYIFPCTIYRKLDTCFSEGSLVSKKVEEFIKQNDNLSEFSFRCFG